MAIYPIVPGQKPCERNFIPPHSSAGNPSSAGQPASADAQDDLIDFDPGDASAPSGPPQTTQQPRTASRDISGLLQKTGQAAPEGPLIDFMSDMKEDLPKPTVRRTNTAGGNDEFHDAKG